MCKFIPNAALLPHVTQQSLGGTKQMTTYYVDPVNGKDDQAGTSETTAWRSLAKVNASFRESAFKRGDSILFKRGGAWRVTGYKNNLYIRRIGASSGQLTIGAYGDGPAPRFDCQGGGIPAIYTNERYPVSHFVIRDLEITNASQALVWIRSASNFTLQELDIHTTVRTEEGGSNPGLYIHKGSRDWLVTKCKLHHTAGEGVYVGSWKDADDGTQAGEISYCDIYNTGAEGIDCKFSTRDVEIHHNTLATNYTTGTGVDIAAIKLGGVYHNVHENVIHDQGSTNGILATYLGVGYSISTSHLTIERNQIDGARYGIHLRGASGDLYRDAAIRNNTISGCERCVYIRYSTNARLRNNSLVSGKVGLYVEGSLPDSDQNAFGDQLEQDCHLVNRGGSQPFVTACSSHGIECNSRRGVLDLVAAVEGIDRMLAELRTTTQGLESAIADLTAQASVYNAQIQALEATRASLTAAQ
jgi:parallel beta-helix repeat protein